MITRKGAEPLDELLTTVSFYRKDAGRLRVFRAGKIQDVRALRSTIVALHNDFSEFPDGQSVRRLRAIARGDVVALEANALLRKRRAAPISQFVSQPAKHWRSA